MPTPQEIQRIRDRLILEQYQTVIVADLRNFLQCIPKEIIKGQDEFSTTGLDSFERYLNWQKSNIKFQPVMFPPKTAKEFINTAKIMNNKNPRISECSNFAYHAAGILLDDPQIRSNYNIAIVGIMEGQHNITVILPKNHTILKNIPIDYRFPEGSFIIDPWAVGMGHQAKNALVVTPEQFAYKGSLYDEKMAVHYQSELDPTLKNLKTNPTLKAYSNASENVINPTQSVPSTASTTAPANPARPAPAPANPARPTPAPANPDRPTPAPANPARPAPAPANPARPAPAPANPDRPAPAATNPVPAPVATSERTQPRSQSASNSKRNPPSSYEAMWRDVDAVYSNRGFDKNLKQSEQMKKILNDYTKDDSTIKRVLTLHWNRHYVKEVNKIVSNINDKKLTNPQEIITELEKIIPSNSSGSFKRRLEFMKEKIAPEENNDRNRPN